MGVSVSVSVQVITNCQLQLRDTNYQLRVANCEMRIIN